jgi:hypothetical protein
LSSIFEGLDQPLNLASQEGKCASSNENNVDVTGSSSSSNFPRGQQHLIVGSIPLVVPELSHDKSWPKPNEEQTPRVYSRSLRIEEQGKQR